jgi:hypothetical protein
MNKSFSTALLKRLFSAARRFGRLNPSRLTGRIPRLGCGPGLLVAAGLLLAPAVTAQTNTVRPRPANRWLLVVDTSSAMGRRAEAVKQIVAMLLLTGVKGQMHAGDTLGVWTYNEALYAGRFPLQGWLPENSRPIARRVFEFLDVQTYEKRDRLDKVLPEVDRLVTNSDFITVILITDGSENLTGTPFDDKINSTYRAWKQQQDKAQMPFVTLLRAKHGKYTDYSVNTPPWPMDLPPLPPELEVARDQAPKPAKRPEQVKPAPVPPLIIRGKKPEPAQTQSPAGPPAAAPRPVASPELSAAEKLKEIASEPQPGPSSPANLETGSPVSTPQPIAASGPAPVPTGALELVEGPGPPAAKPKEVTAAPEPDRSVASAGPVPAASAFSNSVASPSPTAGAPAQTAVAIPSESFLSRNLVWIGGLFLAGVAFGLVILLLRRSRPAARASLITRSLNRDKE